MSSDKQPAQTEDKARELLFEYDQLRKEILGNFTLSLQILGGTVTFVAVIMTLGFSEAVKSYLAKAALFFVGETVAFIGLMQTMSLAHSIFQIASYLRVFTEAELSSPKWETRLHDFRQDRGKLPFEEIIGSVRYTYAFIIVVNYMLACSFALWDAVPDYRIRGFSSLPGFIWEGFKTSPLNGALIVIALLITIYLFIIARRQYHFYVINHDKTFTLKWMEVKKKWP